MKRKGNAPAGVTLRDAFSGKEDQQPDFGVPWLDFGARAYSPSLRRWMVPDPLGEKYYGVNPYAYCSGDPVNYVDPEGRDIWKVYSNGKIKKVRPSSKTVIKTVNNKGKTINTLTLTAGKNSKKVDLSSSSKTFNGKEYYYFSTSSDTYAKEIFEFIASPSNWGFPDNGTDNKVIFESAVLYTTKGNSILMGDEEQVPTGALAEDFIKKGAVFSRIDHVHPGNDPNPSGIGEGNGDILLISYLERMGITFSTPRKDRYHIFTPKDKKYHWYDSDSLLMMNEATCYGN